MPATHQPFQIVKSTLFLLLFNVLFLRKGGFFFKRRAVGRKRLDNVLPAAAAFFEGGDLVGGEALGGGVVLQRAIVGPCGVLVDEFCPIESKGRGDAPDSRTDVSDSGTKWPSTISGVNKRRERRDFEAGVKRVAEKVLMADGAAMDGNGAPGLQLDEHVPAGVTKWTRGDVAPIVGSAKNAGLALLHLNNSKVHVFNF